jgi:hypothetical protein
MAQRKSRGRKKPEKKTTINTFNGAVNAALF